MSPERYRERYRRHELIDWFDQSAVSGCRIAVIGAGAIGNEVIKNLALLGVGSITIFDFDHIERHNLTRSVLFRDDDVGQSKAEVAARRALALDNNSTVVAVADDFRKHLGLHTLRTRFDVVIACVDNFEARMRASLLCRIAGVDFVSAAIDSRFASVQQHLFGRNQECACFECDLGEGVYRRVAERYSCGWLQRTAWRENKVPTTVITASAAGALAASMALRMGSKADGNSPGTDAQRVLIDTISARSTVTALRVNEACMACAQLGVAASLERATLGDIIARHPDAELQFSDALITSMQCRQDPSHTASAAALREFTVASSHDDSIMYCKQCDDLSVVVEMNETVAASRLKDIDHIQGCSFVKVRTGGSDLVYYEIEPTPGDTDG